MLQISLRGPFFRFAAISLVLAATVCACSNPVNLVSPAPKSPTPGPTASGPATATGSLTTSATASTSITLGPVGPGDSATVAVPAASTVAHLQFSLSLTEPAGLPAVMSMRRKPENVNAANIQPFGFIAFTPDTNVTLPDSMIVTWSFPPGFNPPDPAHSYLAVFDPNNPVDPNNPTAGWTLVSGPASEFAEPASHQVGFVWPPPTDPLVLVAGTTYTLVVFTTTSTLATPTPPATATPLATPTAHPSGSPTATPIASPSPTGSPSSSPTPTPHPSASPTPTAHPTATPTVHPTATPTATATPTGFEVEIATASGNGTVDIPQASGSTAAFAILGDDNTNRAFANGQIVVNLGSLPLTGEICQTASNGQCLAPPVSTINPFSESFTAGESETFSVFLTSEGQAINGGTITVVFEDSSGNTLGSASVNVQTQ